MSDRPPATDDEPKVRIVSDGTSEGTSVYTNGQLLENVLAVDWRVKVGEKASARITILDVAVEVEEGADV